jgi:D-amino-acid dehydrogenase
MTYPSSARSQAARGLYVATGHGTLGITLGPVTGRLVTEEMTRQPQPLLAPFRPERFHRKASA